MWRAGRATEETSSGASRTRPIATHLAARQGRRRRAGRASRRSYRRSASPAVAGCPGAAACPAPAARRWCRAAAKRARGGVLPSRPHGGGAISGILRGHPLGTAPQCQGTRTAPGRCLREAAASLLPLRHNVNDVPSPYRCTYLKGVVLVRDLRCPQGPGGSAGGQQPMAASPRSASRRARSSRSSERTATPTRCSTSSALRVARGEPKCRGPRPALRDTGHGRMGRGMGGWRGVGDDSVANARPSPPV